jgi:hypothetical protein
VASENRTEYKVVADRIVSPDNNINFVVEGNVYVGASEAGNRVATISDVGNGGGGPLVVPVNIKDGDDANFITFSRTGTGTARIATPQDDLSLRSARDITLIAGDDGPGNVYIGWGDATITPDATNRVATIADIQAAGTADFVFDTVEAPDYESTMTVTNNDMVIKTVVDTEASGNIRVESAQNIVLNANGDAYIGDSSSQNNRIATMADVGGEAADIADFVFEFIEAEDEESTAQSRITIANHDMVIRTTRTANQDSDISLTSADDIWITANDTVELTSNTDDVVIYTDANGDNYSWKFRQDGVISSENNFLAIESLYNSEDVKGRLKFEPNNGRALLQAYSSNNTATFSADYWDTAAWITLNPGLSQLTLTNASGIISFMENTGYGVDVLKISINDGNYGIYAGASTGDGAITFGIEGLLPEGEVTVTEVRFQYAFSAKVDINFDENQLVIRTEDEMDTVIDSDSTLTLRSTNDFTRVQANRDILFTANYGEDSQYGWKMRQDGRFELPTEGYIKGLFGNSSDGNNYDTIEIIPDFGRYDDGTDQYLVIEPTEAPSGPGHIHIRAGGTIDASTADLILGGEETNVRISDTANSVTISSSGGGISFTGAAISTITNGDDVYIQSKDSSGTVLSEIVLDSGDGRVTLLGSESSGQTFYDSDWGTGVWSGTEVSFTNASALLAGVNGLPGNITSLEINGGSVLTTSGWSGGGTNITFYVSESPAEGSDPVTVTSLGVNYKVTSRISVDQDDDEEIRIYGNQIEVRIDSTEDVRVEAGQDLHLEAVSGQVRIGSTDSDIIISASGGEYLTSATDPNNQIATIGDIQNTVSNGMVRYSPTFAATGLAFTGSGATYPTYNSYYVKSGSMVSFVIEVDLTTVTNFGTGQYKLQLPFTPAVGFNHFTGWAWADPDVDPDTGTGHTIINADTAGVTDVLDLHYLKSAGGANAPIREGLFLQGTPVTLTTISKIYVNGTYIAAANV